MRSILFSIIVFPALTSCAKTEIDVFGRIHGIVTDAETGEPIRTASVTITGGKTTVTGSDGRYDFGELEPGEYTIQVARLEYQTNTKRVNVEPGITTQGDILMYRGAGVLYLSRHTIEFGADNTLSVFEIRNTGQHDLDWEIVMDCEWISEIAPASGVTKAAERTSITVKIDRAKVAAGKQSTVIVVTSNGGAQEIGVSVNGEDTGGGNGGGGTSAVLNGLLAFYTFDDGTANDVTDNKLNASLVNSPALIDDTPAGEGKALHLNKNQEQYLNVPSNPFSGKRTYSVSFWLKDFGEGVIYAAVGSTYANSYPQLRCADRKLILYVRGLNLAGSEAFAYSASAIQDGKWHLITLTSYAVTGNQISTNKLFIDGKLVDTISVYSDNSSAARFQFGGNGNDPRGDYATSMKLDNIRLYDRALSDEEVKIIYEAEK